MVWLSSDNWTFQIHCSTAKALYVVGDFNNWCARANPMVHLGKNKWKLTLPLRPGEYRFRYLTDDGRWLTDYAAFGVIRNSLGGWDSVLYVPPVVPTHARERELSAV